MLVHIRRFLAQNHFYSCALIYHRIQIQPINLNDNNDEVRRIIINESQKSTIQQNRVSRLFIF